MMKSKSVFVSVAVLFFGALPSGCVKLASPSCKSSDTPASTSASDIQTPPANLQKYFVDVYTPTKYLTVSANGATMHLFGTSSVSDWMMVYTHEMMKNMLNSLASSSVREKFDGFKLLPLQIPTRSCGAAWPANAIPGQNTILW